MQQMTWGTLLPPFPENPDSLRAAHANAIYAAYSPRGGEQFGGLRVASVELPSDTSESDVVMALVKLASCAEENIPYQEWSSVEARNFLTLFLPSEGISHWSVSGDAGVFFLSLSTAAKAVAHAQQTLPNPLNQRFAFPNARAVDEHEIDALRFLSVNSLRMVLNDRWNDMVALFEHAARWYLVTWSTNA